MDISKVVIPAAGLGERFLPYSKSGAREMLPLLNKPALQWVAEEALLSELSNMLIVTRNGKESIERHFDGAQNSRFSATEQLAGVEKLIRNAHFSFVRQAEQLGVGHALWLARHFVHKEYFCVALPDDLIFAKQPALAQLIRIARQEKASVIAVQEVPTEQISSYGIIGVKKTITPNLFQVSHIVEKPQPKDAPTNLAIVGRYVLSSKIFQSLEDLQSYEQPSLELSDALCHMIQHNERVFAFKVQGNRYDIGTQLGYLKAVIATGLQDPELGPSLKKFVSDMDSFQPSTYNPAKVIGHSV